MRSTGVVLMLTMILCVTLSTLVFFLFFEWHARFVFICAVYPRRYGHGKSWKRAHKHYKSHWTLRQRLLWLPVFKEAYESKYRWMAYLSYIHIGYVLLSLAGFVLGQFVFSWDFWPWFFVSYLFFTLIRWCHSNAVGRGTI